MHLYALCVDCLEGVHKIICIKCKSRWDGSWHQLGTMYTYDILAASPCCQVGMHPTAPAGPRANAQELEAGGGGRAWRRGFRVSSRGPPEARQ